MSSHAGYRGRARPARSADRYSVGHPDGYSKKSMTNAVSRIELVLEMVCSIAITIGLLLSLLHGASSLSREAGKSYPIFRTPFG